MVRGLRSGRLEDSAGGNALMRESFTRFDLLDATQPARPSRWALARQKPWPGRGRQGWARSRAGSPCELQGNLPGGHKAFELRLPASTAVGIILV
jgi:hypothetical protein